MTGLTANDYGRGYELAMRMMAEPEESGFRKQWHEVAARCLLVASNMRNRHVTYPIALTKRQPKDSAP